MNRFETPLIHGFDGSETMTSYSGSFLPAARKLRPSSMTTWTRGSDSGSWFTLPKKRVPALTTLGSSSMTSAEAMGNCVTAPMVTPEPKPMTAARGGLSSAVG